MLCGMLPVRCPFWFLLALGLFLTWSGRKTPGGLECRCWPGKEHRWSAWRVFFSSSLRNYLDVGCGAAPGGLAQAVFDCALPRGRNRPLPGVVNWPLARLRLSIISVRSQWTC